MPKYRESSRKKTRYADSDSDSSSDYRESSRRYRERSKKSSEKSNRYRQRRSTSKSSSSSSSSDSRSNSRSNHSKSHSRSSSIQNKKSSKARQEQPAVEDVKKFELDELFNEKDKVKALAEIESDSFKQATFKQSSSSKIIVDLEMDKILLPPSSSAIIPQDESLIHPDFLGDNEKRVDKWIKKLCVYRNQ